MALVRDKAVKHIGGDISQRGHTSIILPKTELAISTHNYIQETEIAKSCWPMWHVFFIFNTLVLYFSIIEKT